MMQYSPNLTNEWENKLRELIDDSYYDYDEDEYTDEYDDVQIETFEEAGILTRDRGLVVYLDGKKIHITIQAYERR